LEKDRRNNQMAESSPIIQDDVIRDRAVGLFTYLKKIAELRSKPVYKIDDYEKIIWFSEVPKEKECFTPAWGETRTGQEEIWLGIRKVNFIKPPPVPSKILPWVNEQDLFKSDDIPKLQEKIIVSQVDNAETQPQYLELSDYPDISEQWGKYLDDKWLLWAVENERLLKIQDVFSKLHAIYQLQKTLGETFELVVGFGLLNWRTPSNNFIRRPLIVAQATIELDAKRGNLYVKQGAEGTKLAFEEDMLEISERCKSEIYQKIKAQLSDIGDDVWNVSAIEAALKSWAYSVSAQSVYSNELEPYKEFAENPHVVFAPVLILRKRNTKSLLRTLEIINEQIKKNQNSSAIPFNIRRSVSIIDEMKEVEENGIFQSEFEEVIFPLPSNDEQRKVVKELRNRQGIVVQGPPGTGKSHTIANLISHLLAEGKRVLVTSQTPRALKVLKEKIPVEVAELCVNQLGRDQEALKELEKSAKGINERKQEFNPEENKKTVERLRQQLEEIRKYKADLERQLREIRERETYEHRICDGIYVGTAQRIAKQISSETDRHKWLDAIIINGSSTPLSNEEATEIVRLYQNFSPEEIKEIEKELVQIDKLPTPEEFSVYCFNEKEAREKYDEFKDVKESIIYHKIKTADDKHLMQLKSELRKFLDMWKTLSKHKQPWVCSTIEDVISERDRRWRHLLEETEKCIETLKKHIDQVDKCSLKIAEGKDRSVLKADVETLLKHFEQGGKIRNWVIFYPKVVKKTWHLIKNTYVDGRLCDNAETLKKLLILLKVDEYLENIWREWSVCTVRPIGSRGAQLHDLEDLCEPLLEVMNLYSQMTKAKQSCASIPGLDQPAWHVMEEVELYVRIIDAIEAEKLFKNAIAVFNKVKSALQECKQRPVSHSVVSEIYEVVTNRNEAVYRELYKKTVELEQKKSTLAHRKELYNRLIESPAKSIAENFAADPYKPYWINQFSHFSESWQWAKAKCWLIDYINLSEEELNIKLKNCESEIQTITTRLSAEMAWGHCLSRLTEHERMHLQGYVQEMGKVGKGTGKHAEFHRGNARRLLEQCRSAIPAWVVPLYLVAETVEPDIGIYDVAIIDEASQSSSPEAYFLLYLAKKIIVVGDPEQISPLSGFTDKSAVQQLKEMYIGDLPDPVKSAIGPDDSFFDLAKTLFGVPIGLREHFRCMPEIIQFSSGFCYDGKLIPLRQYPPKRLEPIKTYHVANGYRDGENRTPRNLPESEAIVAKIKECCTSPEYDGKTMGVISLLNEYQARLIDNMLLKAIGPEEMAKRNIVCGDAYAFQGNERDVMFLSMVAAPGETALTALTGRPIKQRFNVAASRARDQMWLFHTPTINDFRNHECFRYQLLKYFLNPICPQTEELPIDIQQLRMASLTVNKGKYHKPKDYNNIYDKYFDSWFEVDVFLKIIDKGYNVIPQFEVAKYFIDLVIKGTTRQLAVECDGDYHDTPEQTEKDMIRERILKRSGWTFWRVRGCEFYFNPSKSLEPLWQKLDELGIAPGGKDSFVDDHTATKSENAATNTADSEQMPDNESIFINQVTQETLFLSNDTNGQRHFSLEELQDAIVAVLKQCPNNSCTKKSLTTRVCRYLNVITRGTPRDKFEHKIMRALDELKNRYVVEEYTATNIRIRLVKDSW
jgi:superfamily I DNA and/or RNA helicase/very-short-patch-repair endonuclease